jgi:hypothetical protein
MRMVHVESIACAISDFATLRNGEGASWSDPAQSVRPGSQLGAHSAAMTIEVVTTT